MKKINIARILSYYDELNKGSTPSVEEYKDSKSLLEEFKETERLFKENLININKIGARNTDKASFENNRHNITVEIPGLCFPKNSFGEYMIPENPHYAISEVQDGQPVAFNVISPTLIDVSFMETVQNLPGDLLFVKMLMDNNGWFEITDIFKVDIKDKDIEIENCQYFEYDVLEKYCCFQDLNEFFQYIADTRLVGIGDDYDEDVHPFQVLFTELESGSFIRLHIPARKKELRFISEELLFDHIHITDEFGDTPLHIAARTGELPFLPKGLITAKRLFQRSASGQNLFDAAKIGAVSDWLTNYTLTLPREELEQEIKSLFYDASDFVTIPKKLKSHLGKNFVNQFVPVAAKWTAIKKEKSLEKRLFYIVQKLASADKNLLNNKNMLTWTMRSIVEFFKQTGMEVRLIHCNVENDFCYNIEAVFPEFYGCDNPHYLVGAHYDSVQFSPGADDNISAVAVMLEIARLLTKSPEARRSVRFVAFVNEEPPFFSTESMGSYIHAQMCREEGNKIEGMICLESLGFFSNEHGSQEIPEFDQNVLPALSDLMFQRGIQPDVGNFLALVGDEQSAEFLKTCDQYMSASSKVPILPLVAPELRLSDQFNYWDVGYPALMLTDTAFYRNPNYHLPTDTFNTLNYPNMAATTRQLAKTLKKMSRKLR
ncbi:MAG: M28 family peptidase [Gammaproteobacteria bacterium]